MRHYRVVDIIWQVLDNPTIFVHSYVMDTTPINIIIHASIARALEKNISLLAQSENRSKSNMIETLLKEAIEARVKKDANRT